MVRQGFDVVIAGGGPAGLLLASKLGKQFRVLILERGYIGSTFKFWVTTRRRLELHALTDCTVWVADTVSMGTYLGGRAVATGDFVVTDEHSLLGRLAERCRNIGVEILECTSVKGCQQKRTQVEVHTSDGCFDARLFVDATGGRSLIAAQEDGHRLIGYFTVYGGHLTGIRLASDEIVLGHVLRGCYPAPVLEVVPTGRESAFCILIYVTSEYIEPSRLRRPFHDHIAQNRFLTSTASTQFSNVKLGSIPIGRPARTQMPGLFCYGEAGLIQPPFTGSAFNEILEHNDLVAAVLGKSLLQSRTIPTPHVRYPMMKRLNDALQTMLIHPLIGSDAHTFDAVARGLSSLKPDLLFRLLSNELRATDTFSLMHGPHLGLIRRSIRAAKDPTKLQAKQRGDIALDSGYD